jgi:hypothetical protein
MELNAVYVIEFQHSSVRKNVIARGGGCGNQRTVIAVSEI